MVKRNLNLFVVLIKVVPVVLLNMYGVACNMQTPVLRIYDILVRVRIRGSVPQTFGSRSGFGSVSVSILADAIFNTFKR